MTNADVPKDLHLVDAADLRAEIPKALEQAIAVAGNGKAIGCVSIVFMENGDAVEFSDTRLANLYHVVGALEAVKARYLRPRE